MLEKRMAGKTQTFPRFLSQAADWFAWIGIYFKGKCEKLAS
jgi:hypothetical protein